MPLRRPGRVEEPPRRARGGGGRPGDAGRPAAEARPEGRRAAGRRGAAALGAAGVLPAVDAGGLWQGRAGRRRRPRRVHGRLPDVVRGRPARRPAHRGRHARRLHRDTTERGGCDSRRHERCRRVRGPVRRPPPAEVRRAGVGWHLARCNPGLRDNGRVANGGGCRRWLARTHST